MQLIRQFALPIDLLLEDLGTIKLTFTSLYSLIYKERGLVFRAQAQVGWLRWYKLHRVLNEEAELLNLFEKWLDEARFPIFELYLLLQFVKDGLFDVELHYREMELRGISSVSLHTLLH